MKKTKKTSVRVAPMTRFRRAAENALDAAHDKVYGGGYFPNEPAWGQSAEDYAEKRGVVERQEIAAWNELISARIIAGEDPRGERWTLAEAEKHIAGVIDGARYNAERTQFVRALRASNCSAEQIEAKLNLWTSQNPD